MSLAGTQLAAHAERLAVYERIAEQGTARFGRTRRMAPLHMGILLEKAYIAFWQDIAANPPEK